MTLEDHDPEVLPPARAISRDRWPPGLFSGDARRNSLLAMTERILEVRASAGGSDITVASFTDSSLDLTEIGGRHGIEIADQVSCAAGWDPLSSSGRRRFWHVHFTLAPQARHLQPPFPPLSLRTSGSAPEDQTAVVCERCALATHSGRHFTSGHTPCVQK